MTHQFISEEDLGFLGGFFFFFWGGGEIGGWASGAEGGGS